MDNLETELGDAFSIFYNYYENDGRKIYDRIRSRKQLTNILKQNFGEKAVSIFDKFKTEKFPALFNILMVASYENDEEKIRDYLSDIVDMDIVQHLQGGGAKNEDMYEEVNRMTPFEIISNYSIGQTLRIIINGSQEDVHNLNLDYTSMPILCDNELCTFTPDVLKELPEYKELKGIYYDDDFSVLFDIFILRNEPEAIIKILSKYEDDDLIHTGRYSASLYEDIIARALYFQRPKVVEYFRKLE